MHARTTSLAAPESDADGHAAAELRLVRLRSQVAVVRALADQVEHLARARDAEGLGDQLSEEVARLGHRLLESAALLAESARYNDSGVFARYSSSDAPGTPRLLR
jgi:hypothetical protein